MFMGPFWKLICSCVVQKVKFVVKQLAQFKQLFDFLSCLYKKFIQEKNDYMINPTTFFDKVRNQLPKSSNVLYHKLYETKGTRKILNLPSNEIKESMHNPRWKFTTGVVPWQYRRRISGTDSVLVQ